MTRYRQGLLVGALFITGSELLFATMGAAVKAVTAAVPVAQVVFVRGLFALVVFLPLLLRGNGPALVPTPSLWPLYAVRALIGLAAMACFFYALSALALADGMLLKMTAPVFMPVIATLWLAERPSRAAMIAVPLGLAGVILVLEPTGRFQVAALVGLAGGALSAVAKVAVRRLTRTEPAVRVVFWFAVVAAVVSAPFALAGWQPPSPGQWGQLLLVGGCASVGQWLLTRGYGAASPGQIGPFTYSSVLFAAGYGALLWGEIPDGAFVAGAALIIAAGLLALRRDAPRPAALEEA
jgi:drug/metabolite transporter (DMT)-like permease